MLSAKKELFTPSGGGYQISRSVRLRSSASAYFTRTPSVAGNRRTFTISAWVKKGRVDDTAAGVQASSLFGAGNTGNVAGFKFAMGDVVQGTNTQIFSSQETIHNVSNQFVWYGTERYRDSSAWYHVVVAFDTPQATASNRLKIWVNGQQIGAGNYTVALAQNQDLSWNNTVPQFIGASTTNSAPWLTYFDGLLAEVYSVDGQALTPSSFGETNAITGVWQPKRYVGTYGTNGFYLPFTLNANSTYAGSFNGSSQGLTTTATGINPSTGSWTIEGWAYSTNAAANEAIITGQVSGSDYLYWNYVGTTLYIGDGVTNILTISNAKPTNQWYHWALVKNGSTYTAYINGQSIGSSTTALRSGTLTTWQIGIRTSVSYYWNGSISNVRVNSTTAIYTTKFTPPISPLTAISGTQLLTLQDATIIDNSTNAYSITNTGSVATTTSTVVFAAPTIGSDASGNVNNWTANNINVSTAGVTYDSMIDVPTLYDDGDKGRGNYAVMNPLDNQLNLSNGNLYAQEPSAGTYGASRATMAIPTSGKWYWEHTIANAPSSSRITVGLATDAAPLASALVGAATTVSYDTRYGVSRAISNQTTVVRNDVAIAFTTNDIVQCAYDAATGKLWFGKNNAWFDTATGTTGNPSAGTNQLMTVTLTGPLFPFISSFNETTGAAAYVNFGQQPFTYTPPTGFKALNTQNLPTPTISNGAGYMDAKLWTGNGTSQTITGFNFQPDFAWIKSRSIGYQHSVYDAVRTTSAGRLATDQTLAETSNGANDPSFTSNGITVRAVLNDNGSGQTFVGWMWNAGGSTVTNTSGTISAQVRANPTAGISVVTYTGTGANATVGHGLGVAPSMIIVKSRNTAATNWVTYHTSLGATKYILLNTTGAVVTDSTPWNNTAPTSSVLSLGTSSNTNGSTATFVAYCFAAVAGYSAFGSYTGNGSADGPFVYCGFRPRYVMLKSTTAARDWLVYDTARGTYNVLSEGPLQPNTAGTPYGAGYLGFDILSNGFKLRESTNNMNANGETHIFMAFAENPFKNSLAR